MDIDQIQTGHLGIGSIDEMSSLENEPPLMITFSPTPKKRETINLWSMRRSDLLSGSEIITIKRCTLRESLVAKIATKLEQLLYRNVLCFSDVVIKELPRSLLQKLPKVQLYNFSGSRVGVIAFIKISMETHRYQIKIGGSIDQFICPLYIGLNCPSLVRCFKLWRIASPRYSLRVLSYGLIPASCEGPGYINATDIFKFKGRKGKSMNKGLYLIDCPLGAFLDVGLISCRGVALYNVGKVVTKLVISKLISCPSKPKIQLNNAVELSDKYKDMNGCLKMLDDAEWSHLQ